MIIMTVPGNDNIVKFDSIFFFSSCERDKKRKFLLNEPRGNPIKRDSYK